MVRLARGWLEAEDARAAEACADTRTRLELGTSRAVTVARAASARRPPADANRARRPKQLLAHSTPPECGRLGEGEASTKRLRGCRPKGRGTGWRHASSRLRWRLRTTMVTSRTRSWGSPPRRAAARRAPWRRRGRVSNGYSVRQPARISAMSVCAAAQHAHAAL